MSLIDATLPVLVAQGHNIDRRLSHRWAQALGQIGVTRVKSPKEPVVASEALYGLDGALTGDYQELFKKLRRLGQLEVVFGDDEGWATALAACWLEEGGSNLVCSLRGVGRLPALESLRLYLHLSGREKLANSGQAFLEIRQLFERLSGLAIDPFEPVLGRGVFAGESGVHVDSWPKDPSLYEPFPPELVGAKRLLTIGRHTGRVALRLKCWQLGLTWPEEKAPDLLTWIRDKAVELERSLTDQEFVDLAESHMGTWA
ncbi:MAG: hypothetical protein LBT38_09785 [Deltaproteobacteria bacterium]|jgi:homocitrate synthase NifV|nr:hypothetical protein [Deltaproteobacteria bacterium]